MHEVCEYRVFINSYEGLECIKYHVGNVVYLVPTSAASLQSNLGGRERTLSSCVHVMRLFRRAHILYEKHFDTHS